MHARGSARNGNQLWQWHCRKWEEKKKKKKKKRIVATKLPKMEGEKKMLRPQHFSQQIIDG